MTVSIQERNKSITDLLNGTSKALDTVIPIQHKLSRPQLIEQSFQIQFGVLIGITGDIRGKLLLDGEKQTFGNIGETMFGMSIENDMLTSFSGELGNMLAGNLSTNIVDNGITIDITAPTNMEGVTQIS